MKRFSILIACFILLGAAATDPLLQRARATFSPIPASLPEIDGNVITDAKVELGKMLFFDPRLSASHLLSCNTCHNLGLAGADLQETSTGHGWQRGPRNAPTVLNAAYNTAQFWDGRAPDLREQAKGPIQAAVEMNNSPDHVLATLGSIPEYAQRFEAAFAKDRDPLSFDNVAKAIEAFEATLQTPGAAFDRYLAGDPGALDEAQKAGLSLFMNKGCASCHGGINLGGNAYFPFGLVKTPAKAIRPESDKGRFAITKTAADEYVFRTPPLRNVELTYPYFHSGKVWTLREAVSVMGASQLGIELDDDQTGSITVFLASLTGNQPEVEYPVLPASTEETPRPRLDFGGEAAH